MGLISINTGPLGVKSFSQSLQKEQNQSQDLEPEFEARSCGWTMRLGSFFMGYRAAGEKCLLFAIYVFRISAQLNCSLDPSAVAFETSVDGRMQTLVDLMFPKLIL